MQNSLDLKVVDREGGGGEVAKWTGLLYPGHICIQSTSPPK